MMTINEYLERDIIREEEYREVPYLDSNGLWTFGIGTCLERSPLTAAQWKLLLDAQTIEVRITLLGAQMLMREKLNSVITSLRSSILVWNSLNEVRQRVLISMGYQMGAGFVQEFPKFIAAVNRFDWKTAAIEGLDSKWARKDSPNRAKRLMNQFERGE